MVGIYVVLMLGHLTCVENRVSQLVLGEQTKTGKMYCIAKISYTIITIRHIGHCIQMF